MPFLAQIFRGLVFTTTKNWLDDKHRTTSFVSLKSRVKLKKLLANYNFALMPILKIVPVNPNWLTCQAYLKRPPKLASKSSTGLNSSG